VGKRNTYTISQGDPVKLLDVEDYIKAELGLWTVLTVLEVRGRTCRVQHDPSYGYTNGREDPVTVSTARVVPLLRAPED